jgi:hypothetical protein
MFVASSRQKPVRLFRGIDIPARGGWMKRIRTRPVKTSDGR